MVNGLNGPLRHRTIPSLDGLRGISIGLVMLAHLQDGLPPAFSSPLLDHGLLGVKIFFVISGFLITRLIAQEMEATGRALARAVLHERPTRWDRDSTRQKLRGSAHLYNGGPPGTKPDPAVVRVCPFVSVGRGFAASSLVTRR